MQYCLQGDNLQAILRPTAGAVDRFDVISSLVALSHLSVTYVNDPNCPLFGTSYDDVT